MTALRNAIRMSQRENVEVTLPHSKDAECGLLGLCQRHDGDRYRGEDKWGEWTVILTRDEETK